MLRVLQAKEERNHKARCDTCPYWHKTKVRENQRWVPKAGTENDLFTGYAGGEYLTERQYLGDCRKQNPRPVYQQVAGDGSGIFEDTGDSYTGLTQFTEMSEDDWCAQHPDFKLPGGWLGRFARWVRAFFSLPPALTPEEAERLHDRCVENEKKAERLESNRQFERASQEAVRGSIEDLQDHIGFLENKLGVPSAEDYTYTVGETGEGKVAYVREFSQIKASAEDPSEALDLAKAEVEKQLQTRGEKHPKILRVLPDPFDN